MEAKAIGMLLDALSDNGISRCNRLPILLPSLLVIANIDPKSRRARSPLTQRRRPLLHTIPACHAVGSDAALA